MRRSYEFFIELWSTFRGDCSVYFYTLPLFMLYGSSSCSPYLLPYLILYKLLCKIHSVSLVLWPTKLFVLVAVPRSFLVPALFDKIFLASTFLNISLLFVFPSVETLNRCNVAYLFVLEILFVALHLEISILLPQSLKR